MKSSTVETELAEYILALSDAAAATRHAGDRPVYQLLLADASSMLALIAVHRASEVSARIDQHERLRGHTFLAGPEHRVIDRSWEKFKATYAATPTI